MSSGAAALELLEQARPSVIVLDMIMPGMHGLEVLRRVRADAALKDVPVIVFSATTAQRRRGRRGSGGRRSSW